MGTLVNLRVPQRDGLPPPRWAPQTDRPDEPAPIPFLSHGEVLKSIARVEIVPGWNFRYIFFRLFLTEEAREIKGIERRMDAVLRSVQIRSDLHLQGLEVVYLQAAEPEGKEPFLLLYTKSRKKEFEGGRRPSRNLHHLVITDEEEWIFPL